MPLIEGQPSSTEEHLEEKTVWKTRELLNNLRLGLPEMSLYGLKEENIHLFLGNSNVVWYR